MEAEGLGDLEAEVDTMAATVQGAMWAVDITVAAAAAITVPHTTIIIPHTIQHTTEAVGEAMDILGIAAVIVSVQAIEVKIQSKSN